MPDPQRATSTRHGLAVLIADDAPYLRAVLVRLLTAAGHCCVAVDGGESALAAARDARFDLILTDQEMPDLDGCTLIARLRGGTGPNRHTPMVLLTGYAGEAFVIAHAAEAGADLVLAKPIEGAQLLHAIAALLHRRAAAAPQLAAPDLAAPLPDGASAIA